VQRVSRDETKVCVRETSESEFADDSPKTRRRCQNQDWRVCPGISLEVTCITDLAATGVKAA